MRQVKAPFYNCFLFQTITEATAATTLQLQFSGYGSNMAVVQKTLDRLGVKEPAG